MISQQKNSAAQRTLIWFSSGAASAVACKFALTRFPEALIVYCETGAEHRDNRRFIRACEKWFGKSIIRIRSRKYKDTWDVWERRKYLAGINGAPCSVELKIIPRLEFQMPADWHVFGYTADPHDQNRAKRFRQTFPELKVFTPLIDNGITKERCIEILLKEKIKIPKMYRLGFGNNNCIPCVKATSPSYWAMIRNEFPDEFYRAARLSRKLGARLCRINGKRKFIDQIPKRFDGRKFRTSACDFLCRD